MLSHAGLYLITVLNSGYEHFQMCSCIFPCGIWPLYNLIFIPQVLDDCLEALKRETLMKHALITFSEKAFLRVSVIVTYTLSEVRLFSAVLSRVILLS